MWVYKNTVFLLVAQKLLLTLYNLKSLIKPFCSKPYVRAHVNGVNTSMSTVECASYVLR